MPFSSPLYCIKTKGKNIKQASLERRILFQTWRFPPQSLLPLLELKTVQFMFDFFFYIFSFPFIFETIVLTSFCTSKAVKISPSKTSNPVPKLRLPSFCPGSTYSPPWKHVGECEWWKEKWPPLAWTLWPRFPQHGLQSLYVCVGLKEAITSEQQQKKIF